MYHEISGVGGHDQAAVQRLFGVVPSCRGLHVSLQASTIDCGEVDTDLTKIQRRRKAFIE